MIENEAKKKTILIACGGTGGHVYPGIAIAQALRSEKVVFVGSKNRQDSKIIPEYGYPFYSITASPKNIFKLGMGLIQSLKIIKKEKPSVVLGTGSYHTIPVILAAKLKGIPILLLEQNVIPGRVNRLLSRIANRVCMSFEDSRVYFKTKNSVVTGNPVRMSFKSNPSIPELEQVLNDSRQMVLVFGGSQGARALNETVASLYLNPEITHSFVTVHIAGTVLFEKTYPKQSYGVIKNAEGLIQAIVLPYAEDMGTLYKRASLVISRSGATTIAELLVFKKPAILVPYPFATDNHQVANAEAFCRDGKGLILFESDLSAKRLLGDIQIALTLPFPEVEYPNATQVVCAQIKEILNVSPSH